MDSLLYLRGIAIGFAIAAPIGPVGLLCIRKALADGRVAAWGAGLGAALADTVFGAVVGLGLGVASEFFAGHAIVLRLIGGLFLLGIGLRTWRAAALAIEPMSGQGPGLLRGVATTFLITMTNPGTILGVMGVFAAFGAQPVGAGEAWQLVGGVFSGSALWWTILTELTIVVRAHFTPQRMRQFNHASGALLMVFGLAAWASLAF